MDYLDIKELYHHGIKGQKWGYRRYQNEDGTLTEAGKKRYGDFNDRGGFDARGEKQMKRDKLAIKGQKLYEHGISRENIRTRRHIVNAVGTTTAGAAWFIGSNYFKSIKNKPYIDAKDKKILAATGVALVTSVAGLLVNNFTADIQRRKLMAYEVNGPKQIIKINQNKDKKSKNSKEGS